MSQKSISKVDLKRLSVAGKSQQSGSLSQYKNGREDDVVCDFCIGIKRKAVKSCLSCLASYCETHLETHYEYPAFMKHKLVKATGKIQDKICSHHDKLLEFYCRTDQLCICALCMMDEHKSHSTVYAAVERTEKQKLLGTTLMQAQQRILDREKRWQELRQTLESLKLSAQTAIEENERMFTDFIRSVERRHVEVKELIIRQEKAAVSKAEGLLRRLEEEISELRRRHTELEQLSHSDDHIHFIQSWHALSAPSGYEDLSSVSVNHHVSFGAVRKAISEMRKQLDDACKGELDKISARVKGIQIIHTGEPKTREEFLQYHCNLTLEPNTAHRNLALSQSNTQVMMSSEEQPHSDHPHRFDHWQQVLCMEGLREGRFYWEVEWKGSEADIAVTYKDINRKGTNNNCSFGWNDHSWSLYCSASECSFVHNSVSTALRVPSSRRIGVYLDHKAGLLCFYSISDAMMLLQRVQTTFKEAVYPAFGLWGYGSSITLS